MSSDLQIIGDNNNSHESVKHLPPAHRKLQVIFVAETILLLCILLIVIVLGIVIRQKSNKLISVRELQSLHSKPPSRFEDLNNEEVQMVKEHIIKQLNLTDIDKAKVNDSYLYTIRLVEPLKGDEQTERQATAIVFHGSWKDPVVQEYIVGPLSTGKPFQLKHRVSRTVNFQKRPVSRPELDAMKFLIDETTDQMSEELLRLYKAAPDKSNRAGSDVLINHYAPTLVTDGVRNTWFRFARNVDVFIQYPIDFQLNVVHDGVDVSKWKIKSLWFRGDTFWNVKDVLERCRNSSVINTFRPHRRSNRSSNFQKALPKRCIENSFHMDNDNYLIVQDWRLKVAFRSLTGLRLFNITHKGRAMAYEMGLSETATVYNGETPFLKHMFVLETVFGVGSLTFSLKPTIDCPDNAVYFSAWVVTEGKSRLVERAVCVFTHQLSTPNYGNFDGQTENEEAYVGTAETAVTVRSISTLFNYDYIFDYTFYSTGVIEMSVMATGNVHLEIVTRGTREGSQGALIFAPDGTKTDLYAPTHNHFFNYKIDMDVLSTRNSFHLFKRERTSFRVLDDLMSYEDWHEPFNTSDSNYLSQCFRERHLCCYRILNRAGRIRPPLPSNFSASIPFVRTHMVVAVRHENESESSIIYNAADPANPEVNFEDFIDSEDMTDKDLVVWLTMGFLHIPRSEDLPFGTTISGALRTFLIPVNFHTCSP